MNVSDDVAALNPELADILSSQTEAKRVPTKNRRKAKQLTMYGNTFVYSDIVTFNVLCPACHETPSHGLLELVRGVYWGKVVCSCGWMQWRPIR